MRIPNIILTRHKTKSCLHFLKASRPECKPSETRLPGTSIPSRRNGGAVAPEQPRVQKGCAHLTCRAGPESLPSPSSHPTIGPFHPKQASFPQARENFPMGTPPMRRFRRSSRLFHDGWTKASSGAVPKAPRQGSPGGRPHLRKRVRGRPVTRSYCSHGRGSGGARRVSPDGL